MRHLVDDGAFASSSARRIRTRSCSPSALAELQHAGERVGVIAGWAAFRVGSTDLGTFVGPLHAEPVVRDAALLAIAVWTRPRPGTPIRN